MSHALACVFTGGWVSGLTIVEDGNGHGGLTFTHGGIPFIYSQAGYMGEAIWGCLLLSLARFPRGEGLSAIGEARSASCGSTLKVGLVLDETGAITRVGLAAHACAVGQAAAAVFAAGAVA